MGLSKVSLLKSLPYGCEYAWAVDVSNENQIWFDQSTGHLNLLPCAHNIVEKESNAPAVRESDSDIRKVALGFPLEFTRPGKVGRKRDLVFERRNLRHRNRPSP